MRLSWPGIAAAARPDGDCGRTNRGSASQAGSARNSAGFLHLPAAPSDLDAEAATGLKIPDRNSLITLQRYGQPNPIRAIAGPNPRSEEHTSELQSRGH